MKSKFFSVEFYSTQVDFALLVLRIVTGVAFMLHGMRKIQNPFGWMGDNAATPAIFQALAALSEFGGGLALIIGLLTRLSALGIACTMVVATWTHAVVRGDPFVGSGGGPSYELALVFFSIALLFVTSGPGRFSLDKVLFGEKS